MATFYRGIALAPATAAEDRDAILRTGLLNAKGRWTNTRADPAEVRRLTPLLVEAPATTRKALGELPQSPMSYACAGFDDAAVYATREAGEPVVVSIEIPFADVGIDGKDFLCTVFQFWDRGAPHQRAEVREILGALFGEAMGDWFDRAAATKDQQARIGLVDLAIHDLAAIEAHYGNELAMAGRSSTVFRSAFEIPAQVERARVLAVDDVVAPVVPPARTVDFRALIR